MKEKLVETITYSLGWEPPTKHQHRGELESPIEWYESGELEDVLLQINLAPVLSACVYAMRYRICSGWHEIQYASSEVLIRGEIERLSPWLKYSWFRTASERKKYRAIHPECANYTWRRLREEGPPYSVSV